MEDDFSEGNEYDKFTRSQARDKAIKAIKEKYPDYFVEKASREEGSGIKIHKPNLKKPIIVKFYHSRTYPLGDIEHSWHSVNLYNVLGTVIDFCMFSLYDSEGNWNFLIYEPEELGWYNENNRSNQSHNLYLYFVVKNGKATEIREGKVNVTDHLNNLDVLN